MKKSLPILAFSAGATMLGAILVLRLFHDPKSERPPTASIGFLAHNPQPGSLSSSTRSRAVTSTRRLDLEAIKAQLAKAVAIGRWQLNKEWEVIVNALSSDDIRALMAELEDVTVKSVRDPLRNMLFSRWGECDPAGALTWIEKLPEKNVRDNATTLVLQGWAYSDPDSLATWLRGLPPGSVRNLALECTLDALSGSRPQSAFALLQQTGNLERNPGLQQKLFAAWAGIDPNTAARQAAALPAGRVRDQALAAIAQTWGAHDPHAALAYAQSLAGSGQSSDVLRALFHGWSQSDAVSAMAALPQLPPESRTLVAGAVIGQLARQDPDAALKAVRELGSTCERTRALQSIVSSLTGEDPSLAAAFVAALPPSPAQLNSLAEVAAAYAAADPTAALNWARSLPEGTNRANALAQVINQLATSDPQIAMVVARTLPSAQQERVIGQTLGQWAERDFSGALAWAQQLPGPQDRTRALSGLASQWAVVDPRAAFDFLVSTPQGANVYLFQQLGSSLASVDARAATESIQRLPVGALRDAYINGMVATFAERSPTESARFLSGLSAAPMQAFGSVASQWANSDPVAAGNWAASLPLGPVRDVATSAIASSWAMHDAGSAAQWLATLPIGSARDGAAQSYVDHLYYQLPEYAAAVSLTIGNDAQRTAAINNVARTWLGMNRSAAEAWIAQAPLPAATKQRLLAR